MRPDDVLVERLCTDYAKPADVASARKEDIREAARRMNAAGVPPEIIARRLHINHDTATRWVVEDRQVAA